MSRFRFCLCTFIILIVVPQTSMALETPARGKFDHRVRSINYEPQQVTLVHGHVGYTTHIQFAEYETVTDVAMGDPKAWAVNVKRNNLFLKPAADDADTNMSVLTDKRTYLFDLRAFKDINKHVPFFLISFRYPHDEAQAAVQQAKAEELQAKLNAPSTARRNWNYWKLGEESVCPTGAYDDGTFTYFTFPANRALPAVYLEGKDKSESIVNSHIADGNTIVIQTIGERFVLRKGNSVACVMNRSYNADGVRTDTGTTIPGVKRVLNKFQKNTPGVSVSPAGAGL